MGKRKRRADRNNTPPPPPPPAFTSHNSQMESSLKEKSSHSFGSTGAKPTSSTHTNNVERSHHAHHQSAAHHRHHNVNRPLLSRAPRHYYSMQHTQINAANRSGTSTSHGKITLRGDKLSWKIDNKPPESLFSPNSVIDASQRLNQLNRVKSKTVIIDAVSCGVMNMHCRLCQKTTLDYSVVAVLVCGHVYHADCLEIRTCKGDKRDPPCPLCTSLV